MSRSVKSFTPNNRQKEANRKERNLKESRQDEHDQKVLLNRKIKDMKPWQSPKGTFRLDREIKLGTRLKGEIKRRPDRPFSEISLADDTKYDRFDEFERNLDRQNNYVKNRLNSINERWHISNSVPSHSFVSRDIIPKRKKDLDRSKQSMHRSKESSNPSNNRSKELKKSSKNRPKEIRCKQKKRFLDIKKIAKRLSMATQRS